MNRKDVTLGVCSHTHDSAAALIVGDSVVGACEEERLNHEKHTKQFPISAINWLLSANGLTMAEVDRVAYNFEPNRYDPDLLEHPGAVNRRHGFKDIQNRTFERVSALRTIFPTSTVEAVQHHKAHAAYAACVSDDPDTAVLVIDSLGEQEATTKWRYAGGDGRFEPGKLSQTETIQDPHSLGYLYGAVTQHLGYRRGDEEGTVMALAATGDPARFRTLFETVLRSDPSGYTLNLDYVRPRTFQRGAARLQELMVKSLGPARSSDDEILPRHADIAAALQESTERAVMTLAANTKASTLVVTGGVALNCVANGVVRRARSGQTLVPSNPGDAGTALGAALVAHGQSVSSCSAASPYLGPSYGIDEVRRAAATRGLTLESITPLGCAKLLVDGACVGYFSGRMEYGPRALGSRSILASPLETGIVDRLNRIVKFREAFRPFAPLVPEECASDWFELSGYGSPFMSFALEGTTRARTTVPAIFHRNNLSRVQTVPADHSSGLHGLLTAFGELTGVPILINTSLNVKGKPIAASPDDALDVLSESGLDAVVFDGCIVRKVGS